MAGIGGQREKLWAALQAEAARAGEPPKDAPRYVEKNNLTRVDYPRYRKLDMPISSARMELVVKQFNRRMEATEKFWLEFGAEEVLQVRAAYLSGDGRAEILVRTAPLAAPTQSECRDGCTGLRLYTPEIIFGRQYY